MRGCCRQGCAALCAPVGSDAILPWSCVTRICMCGPITVADTCDEKSCSASGLLRCRMHAIHFYPMLTAAGGSAADLAWGVNDNGAPHMVMA